MRGKGGKSVKFNKNTKVMIIMATSVDSKKRGGGGALEHLRVNLIIQNQSMMAALTGLVA